MKKMNNAELINKIIEWTTEHPQVLDDVAKHCSVSKKRTSNLTAQKIYDSILEENIILDVTSLGESKKIAKLVAKRYVEYGEHDSNSSHWENLQKLIDSVKS